MLGAKRDLLSCALFFRDAPRLHTIRTQILPHSLVSGARRRAFVFYGKDSIASDLAFVVPSFSPAQISGAGADAKTAHDPKPHLPSG